jgi:hypothetical protein
MRAPTGDQLFVCQQLLDARSGAGLPEPAQVLRVRSVDGV